MAIVRFEPFRELMSLQDRLNRLFNESYRPQGEDDWALGGTWAPAVDIYEHENNIVIKAELPGVDPKDVDIRLDNNVLTVKGERKADPDTTDKDYFVREVAYGGFQRSFALPEGVDATQVEAKYANGMLEVRIPAPRAAMPRTIEVKAA